MRVSNFTRRRLLTTAGAAIAAPAILRVTRASAQDAVFKIGFVSPQTGPIAGFGEADGYILEGIAKSFAGGIENNGKPVKVEIITKDSQSNPNRASEVASELILQDQVNLIVAASTPDSAYLARSAIRSCTSLTDAAAAAFSTFFASTILAAFMLSVTSFSAFSIVNAASFVACATLTLLKSANCSVAEYMVYLSVGLISVARRDPFRSSFRVPAVRSVRYHSFRRSRDRR